MKTKESLDNVRLLRYIVIRQLERKPAAAAVSQELRESEGLNIIQCEGLGSYEPSKRATIKRPLVVNNELAAREAHEASAPIWLIGYERHLKLVALDILKILTVKSAPNGTLSLAHPPEADEQKHLESVSSVWLEVVEAPQALRQLRMKVDNTREVDIGNAKTRVGLEASSSTRAAPPKAIDVQLGPRVAHNYIGHGFRLGSTTTSTISFSEPSLANGQHVVRRFLKLG